MDIFSTLQDAPTATNAEAEQAVPTAADVVRQHVHVENAQVSETSESENGAPAKKRRAKPALDNVECLGVKFSEPVRIGDTYSSHIQIAETIFSSLISGEYDGVIVTLSMSAKKNVSTNLSVMGAGNGKNAVRSITMRESDGVSTMFYTLVEK